MCSSKSKWHSGCSSRGISSIRFCITRVCSVGVLVNSVVVVVYSVVQYGSFLI